MMRFRLLQLFVNSWLAISCATACVLANPSPPARSAGLRGALGKRPENVSLAFTGRVDRNLDIYVLTKTELKRITADPANDEAPCWSPDGTRLAFASKRSGNYEIYTMDKDGFDVRQVTRRPDFDNLPSWSPDSKTIAFESLPESGEVRSGNRILLMNSDGTNVRSMGLKDSLFRVAWSPDGKRLAVSLEGDWGSAIDIVRSDGTQPVRIVKSKKQLGVLNPAWSPDGSMIAYDSFSHPAQSEKSRSRISNIHLVNADGSNDRRLTNLVAQCGLPTWSADGQAIAFSVYPSLFDPDADAKASIYVVRADGSNLTRITGEDEDAFFPAWRPAVK